MPWDIQKNNYPSNCNRSLLIRFFNLILDAPRTYLLAFLNFAIKFDNLQIVKSSVANPDNTYVFGPPGSGSISTRYGSGSGSWSFYHHAKIVWNLDSYCFSVLWLLYVFLPLKKDVNVASKSKNQEKLGKKSFLVSTLKVTDGNCRIRGRIRIR